MKNKKEKESKTFATFPLSEDDHQEADSGVQLPRVCQIAAAKKWVDENEK